MRLTRVFLKAVLAGIGTTIGLKIGEHLYRLAWKALEQLRERPLLEEPPSERRSTVGATGHGQEAHGSEQGLSRGGESADDEEAAPDMIQA